MMNPSNDEGAGNVHRTGAQRWSNWYGNVTSSPSLIARPGSEDELGTVIAEAAQEGRSVRATGAGHSNTPICATDGVLVDLERMQGLVDVDRDRRLATFGAGTTIADIGPLLWEHGLSLANQGDINSQRVAGAIATGTHGTGLALPSLSGAVAGARAILSDGRTVVIDEESPDLLRAVRCALGVLGVLSTVTIEVTEAFCLEMDAWATTWEELLDQWDELLTSHRHFTFYWCPTGDNSWVPVPSVEPAGNAREAVIVKTMRSMPADEPPRGEKFHGPVVDRAYRMWPDALEPDFHELEYMVPVEAGREAVTAVRELLRTEHPDELLPVEVRFTGADDAWMSPFAGRPSCAISVSGRLGADNTRLFRDCDRLLAPFSPRPHWGKWHESTHERLATAFPRYLDFCRTRARLDPAGTFLNDHTRDLFPA